MLAGAIGVLGVASLGGCHLGERLEEPATLRAPYAQPRVWAVAPFLNETGVSRLDPRRTADLFTTEIEQVDGLQTVPLNRVLAAMEVLGIDAVTSEADAIALLNVVDVDGIVVGTMTAFDPYPPLQLGLAVRLYTRDQMPALKPIDPKTLVRSGVGEAAAPETTPIESAGSSGVFDASNHATRRALHAYSRGRAFPDSAYGERIYDVSMDLYTRFVSHRLIDELLHAERRRLVAVAHHEEPAR